MCNKFLLKKKDSNPHKIKTRFCANFVKFKSHLEKFLSMKVNVN